MQNRIRHYRESLNTPLQKQGKSPPLIERGTVLTFFILEKYGDKMRAFPNIELSQTLSHLRRNTKDEEALETADALLSLSLRNSILPPSFGSDSDSFSKLQSDLQGFENSALDILCKFLAKSALSLIITPPELEIQDTQTKPAVFFKKVVGTLRRLQKIDYATLASKQDKAILIIEAARILTERVGEEPTKTQVREFMEGNGWGMGSTHDAAGKWRRAWEKSGLNTLPE